ncbi:hypothetical protein NECID01_2005 [Nematocida sp. AWRm77]|nr:hypothetical protein NECID01_2005 [Nematocida sp. AWRm77]
MQNIGRLFSQEWMLPVKSLSLLIVFKSPRQEDTWKLKYSHSEKAWHLNGRVLHSTKIAEISFMGTDYFLALQQPSDGYLHEIEEVAALILSTEKKQRTLSSIYRALRRESAAYRVSSTPEKASCAVFPKEKSHYKSLLAASKCFIKISLEDTLGKRKVVWKVNKGQIENFKRVKASTQTVLVELADQKESISLFYKEPQRPNPDSKRITAYNAAH